MSTIIAAVNQVQQLRLWNMAIINVAMRLRPSPSEKIVQYYSSELLFVF